MQNKSTFFSKKNIQTIDRSIFFDRNLSYLIRLNQTTTDEVALLINRNPSQVSKYRQGLSYPKFEILIQLTTIFDVNLHEFVFEDIEEKDRIAESEAFEKEIATQEYPVADQPGLQQVLEEILHRLDKLEEARE